MARFVLPARRAPYAVVAVSGLSAFALSQSRPIHLDAPPPPQASSSSSKRLSIYPEPEPEVVLEETHTELERQIGNARVQATQLYAQSRSQVQGAVSRWIGVEEAVESRVKALKPTDEDLTPGILFVGVATLAGSVIARTRSLPVRVLLPPTLLLVAFPQFLPKTSANLRAYFASLEDAYTPTLASSHDQIKKSVSNATADAWKSYGRAKEVGKDSVENALKKAEEWSGLKLGANVGVSEEDSGKKVVKVEVGKPDSE